MSELFGRGGVGVGPETATILPRVGFGGGYYDKFLAAHPEFKEVGRFSSLPCDSGHDGAFACALERAGEKG